MTNNIPKEEPIVNEIKAEKLIMWKKIKYVCYFLPILTTVAFVLNWAIDIPNVIADGILLPMACIGWLAALLTGPIKFLKGVVRSTLTGWNLGSVVGIVGALFGGLIGTVAGLAAILYAPAVFTIHQAFEGNTMQTS